MSAPVLLFTGFPGFIGARLIPRLLELAPDARLVCLVQEKFRDTARADVVRLERDHPQTAGRLELVTGDIALPGLGLEPAAAARLRAQVTGAWHLAAVYDLAVRRDVAFRINVEGTREVLNFVAAAHGFERLHYVSTAYVSGAAVGVFRESDLEQGQAFKNHYEETKYLAEVEVVRSGIAATIYRPGIVVGDSRSGETAKFDGPYFALHAMEKLPSPGLFLRIGSGRAPINVVPVDYVVEAMARLSTLAQPGNRTYNLTDPEPLAVGELARLFARALGKRFLFVPLPAALGRLLLSPDFVQRFLGMPVETLDYFDHPCRYDASHAVADLAAFGVSCPRFPDYVDRLVAFYRTRRDQVRRGAMI
jgi:thioester reductase-like protein